MMYTCIAKLPFFEQFKADNKEKLIQELTQGNNKLNDGGKVYNVDINKKIAGEENSSNFALTKGINKDDIEERKKKCGCWFVNIFI